MTIVVGSEFQEFMIRVEKKCFWMLFLFFGRLSFERMKDENGLRRLLTILWYAYFPVDCLLCLFVNRHLLKSDCRIYYTRYSFLDQTLHNRTILKVWASCMWVILLFLSEISLLQLEVNVSSIHNFIFQLHILMCDLMFAKLLAIMADNSCINCLKHTKKFLNIDTGLVAMQHSNDSFFKIILYYSRMMLVSWVRR